MISFRGIFQLYRVSKISKISEKLIVKVNFPLSTQNKKAQNRLGLFKNASKKHQISEVNKEQKLQLQTIKAKPQKSQDIGVKDENKRNLYKQVLVELNVNQSLHSHIMRSRSVDQLVAFCLTYKDLLTFRLLSIACRCLVSLYEREKGRMKEGVNEKMNAFLGEVFSIQLGDRKEEIKSEQLRNLLYFVKKCLIQLGNNMGLVETSPNYNIKLSKLANHFLQQITAVYLSPDFDYSKYQLNQLIQIYYELIRLSVTNQNPQIYHEILKNQQLIIETQNPHFLFSTGNILLAVKTIEISQNLPTQNHHLTPISNKPVFGKKKNQTIINTDQTQSNQQLINLRQQCYRLFFDKWLYYYNDMTEFLKFSDLQHIWALIIQSYSGAKTLLQKNNGIKAIQVVSNMVQFHKGSIEQLLMVNLRVLANTIVVMQILDKRLIDEKQLVSKVRKQCLEVLSNLDKIQKQKVVLRMKSFVEKLFSHGIIKKQEEKELMNFIKLS